MEDYESVNKEIQSFIASKNSRYNHEGDAIHKHNTDIEPILNSLLQVYSEINMHLKNNNAEGLKDVILKSDIKMNMVAETLLETLRKTISERNQLQDESAKIEKQKLELEEEFTKNKIHLAKLESEVEYKMNSVSELNRIIKDQKDKIIEFKDDIQKMKNEVNVYRVKLEELESLRKRSIERFDVYEKELSEINRINAEIEDKLKKANLEKKEEENKNSHIKTRQVEMEQMVEMLEKKLELKDHNLTLCNSELSKLIVENKKFSAENEKYRSNAIYYENLYNNLNSQNSYLNSQLNKIIQNEEYSKDKVKYVEKFKRKIKKYKKKAKMLKNDNDRIQEEFDEIKDKLEDKNFNYSPSDTTEVLHTKIEELINKNREYKAKISELEKEKKKHSFKQSFNNDAFHMKDEDRYKSKTYGEPNPRKIKYDSSLLQRKDNELYRQDFPITDIYSNRYPLEKSIYSSFEDANRFQNNRKSHNIQNIANHPNSDTKVYSNYNEAVVSSGPPYKESLDKNNNNFNVSLPIKNPKNTSSNEGMSTGSREAPLNDLEFNNAKLENQYNLGTGSSINVPSRFYPHFNEQAVKSSTSYNPVQTDLNYSSPIVNNIYSTTPQTDPYKNIPGGFIDKDESIENESAIETQLQHTYDFKKDFSNYNTSHANPVPGTPVRLDTATKKELVEQLTKLSTIADVVKSQEKPKRKYVRKSQVEGKNSAHQDIDESSTESVKTFHTTSTLRDMMTRTDKLQQKFENLEHQLAGIQDGEDTNILRDKIKTYNNYYSDINVEDGDSEIF